MPSSRCGGAFVAGCGGDQNPLPRNSVELAKKYGNEIADAVEDVLNAPLKPIKASLSTAYSEIDLPYENVPTREQLESDKATEGVTARRAKLLLAQLEYDGTLKTTYPFPIHCWKLGGELTWFFLGGEAVVDYSLRLKDEFGKDTWVTSYTDDVMGYIPSRRVLLEGGYEATGASSFYGRPSPWSVQTEELIVGATHRLALSK